MKHTVSDSAFFVGRFQKKKKSLIFVKSNFGEMIEGLWEAGEVAGCWGMFQDSNLNEAKTIFVI